MTTFTSVGDAGDLFLSLATIKSKGEKAICYLYDNGQTAGILRRFDGVASLVKAQPYIKDVKPWNGEHIDWHSENFRKYGYHGNGLSLALNHAEAAVRDGFISTFPDVKSPWLTVKPSAKWAERVVINKTTRYENPHFPWRKIVEHYGNKLVFLGTQPEHDLFQQRFGEVEYYPTANFLIAAQVIAGSALLIANQSSCMVIAEGLKHPRIQEVCLWLPDCIYNSSPNNAQYSADGSMTLPAVGDTPELVIERTKPKPEVNIHETPPGMWQYPDCPTQMSPHVVITFMRQNNPKMSKDEAMEALIEYNMKRIPLWFDGITLDPELKKFMIAKRNAGIA